MKSADVAFWPKADMTARDFDVRFRRVSGHRVILAECLLLTHFRHQTRFQPFQTAGLHAIMMSWDSICGSRMFRQKLIV
jgi:hypothetical protein